MGFEINMEEMKKKTEIEDKLLFNINSKFQEYTNEIQYIKNNYSQIENNFNIKKYISSNLILSNNNDDTNKLNELEIKFLDYPNTIYSIFQCFYLKRKNYMGMNLTGLVQGKMETGLSFRNSIIKSSPFGIKDDELKNIINKYFKDDLDSINIYKIKSNGFKWKDNNLDNFQFIYLIANLSKEQYFFILEK